MTVGHRVRQFFGAIAASVRPEERDALRSYLNPAQMALFAAMPANDQRHAMVVLGKLVANGELDEQLLQAALLHDVGKAKGAGGILMRVAAVLLRRLHPRLIGRLAEDEAQGWRRALYVVANHATIGAELAAAAGSTPQVVRLISGHHNPALDSRARALGEADEKS